MKIKEVTRKFFKTEIHGLTYQSMLMFEIILKTEKAYFIYLFNYKLKSYVTKHIKEFIFLYKVNDFLSNYLKKNASYEKK